MTMSDVTGRGARTTPTRRRWTSAPQPSTASAPLMSSSTGSASTSPPGHPCCEPPRRPAWTSRSCARPTLSRLSAPAGCAWWRSRAAKGTPASCTTPCVDGMVVSTQTEQVRDLRRGVMELYLSDHPTDCPGCARGNCEMQDLALQVGVAEVRYGLDGANHLSDPVDISNPYFAYDPKACIVCSRCVRACAEVQGTFALTVEGRGFDSRITAGGTSFLNSECVSCGACVQACPTDALAEKSVIELGMPTRSVDTTCAYCGVGCSFRAEVQGTGDATRVVRMMPSKAGGANEGHSCVKGRFAYGYASHRDRQLEPMVRNSIHDEWRVTSWEEAITRIANGFKEIQSRHGVGADGRHLVLPLHQRGGLRRPEDGPGRLPQQQHRHVRSRVPLPHRLWPQPDAGHLGRHPGLQVGGALRRHAAHRGQPDGRPPRLRLPDEASTARGRRHHRCRPAPHRPRPLSARGGQSPPAPSPREQRRLHQRDGAHHRHRGPARRVVHPGSLRERRPVPRVHLP